MAEPLHPEHLREVRLVVFDFDGVFTDNRVIVSEDGRESVICSRADGLGLAAIRRFGVDSLILSTEVNPVVSARARKLGVECQQGLGDGKGAALARLLEERQLDVKCLFAPGLEGLLQQRRHHAEALCLIGDRNA